MKKQISYHYRLYLEVSCVIFILMLVIGAFFYKYDTTLMRNSVEENTIEALSTLHTRLDDRLIALDGVAKKIQISEEFLEIVSSIIEGEDNYFQKYPRIKEAVNQLILQNLVSEKLDTSAHFISKYMDTIGVYMKVEPYNRLSVTKESLKSDAKLEAYLNTDKYVLYEAPCQSRWYSQDSLEFSIIRPIRDNFETYGVLEISQTMKEMDELLALEEFPDTYEVMILNEEGKSCYTYGEGSLGMKENELEVSKLAKAEVQYLDEGFLLCSHKSKMTGWTMVMIRRMDGLKGQLYSFLKLLLSVFALIFAAVLLFLFLITKSLTRPLRDLKDKLCTVEVDKEIHLDIQSESNEVTALAIGIKEFLNQIRDQNRLMIEIRKRVLKAQLDRMEAQMNPHFLYNALAVIGACGQEDGSERVYKMSRGLADLLRYSIKYDHSQVEFQDEIQNIRNYLLIMGFRYEDQVQVEWELDETLTHVMVPKLSFQPVLENCFKHGFKSRKKIWKIKIRTMRLKNQWRFIVKNNGEPFSEERLSTIKEKYKTFVLGFLNGDEKCEENEPAGLGLENTLKRLFIQYGDGAFWKIHTEGEWTIVEIGGEISEEKMQVLIVEDEPVILRSVKRGVEQISDLFSVADVAYDGSEALELMGQNQYDVVISDIVMPQMDGLMMLSEARKQGCNASFILLSGYDRFEYAQTAIDLRVVKYLLKPVDFEELKNCLLSIADKNEPEESVKKSEKFWEKLKKYLDEHYVEDISCKDLAEQFGYNEKYITAIFKEKNGCTPSRYMVEKRMQKAKELLIRNQDELLLKEIAGKVGYTDPLYFSKVFKNCTGYSPSSYMKQHRNGEELCN